MAAGDNGVGDHLAHEQRVVDYKHCRHQLLLLFVSKRVIDRSARHFSRPIAHSRQVVGS
jgi:hypothetical protein